MKFLAGSNTLENDTLENNDTIDNHYDFNRLISYLKFKSSYCRLGIAYRSYHSTLIEIPANEYFNSLFSNLLRIFLPSLKYKVELITVIILDVDIEEWKMVVYYRKMIIADEIM